MTKQIQNRGLYQALIAQLNKAARHNRQGSFRTKDRYYKAMARFCRFLADDFHLQKLSNVSAKHLTAYILKLQAEGKSASTIKTDLSAIRFFHDKISETKYRLPDNDALAVDLERRRFGGVDRTWSQREFGLFVLLCKEAGREDYAAVASLSYYAGLRIHECFRLDTSAAENALRSGRLTVKGKGGKVRAVPINETIRIELRELLKITPRGHKLFVADDVPTDIAINRLQQFIHAVRPQVQDSASSRPMTHHGLRHSFTARTYQALLQRGVSPLDASYQVSRLLGHERPDVTRIYLASVQDKEDGDGT